MAQALSRTCAWIATVLLATTLVLAAPAPSARATPRTSIEASFTPERLGAPTTVSLGFRIAVPGGGLPAPLTAIDFHYPADLGLSTSGLGTAACDPTALQAHGPAACPPNSVMGRGSAFVEVPLGPEIVKETASIVLLAGPSSDGRLRLLVCATGLAPVAARIVMPTLLSAGHLHIDVPLVASLPEGPAVAVVRVHVTLGGRLTYYERAHGKLVAYHPRGIVLPQHCPRGGFRFAADFGFLDGTHASARLTERCPKRR